ncbi:MAG: histidine kinase dimerization/phosphoacceptor domain -containing protein [Synechococcus sp.]|nr:histidine kinase dimerization/phosphoacceptor domain -containing protein [Synechococcus sp.]
MSHPVGSMATVLVKQLWHTMAIALGYFLLGSYALAELSVAHGEIAGFWWPQGLAVACALKWGWRVLPGIFFGELACGLLHSLGPSLPGMSVGIALSQCLVVATVCLLEPHLMTSKDLWDSVSNMRGFLIIACIGSALHTLVGGWLIYGLANKEALPLHWFTGGFGATVTLAPLLLGWYSPRRRSGLQDLRTQEFALLLLVTITGSLFLNAEAAQYLRGLTISFYLCILLWGAFRFSPPAVMLIFSLLIELALWMQPSNWEQVNIEGISGTFVTRMSLAYTFLSMITLMILVVNSDRQRLTQELQAINRRLIDQVEQKTTALDQAQAEIAKTALSITEAIPMGTYTMVLPPNGTMANFSFMSEQFLRICGLEREEAQADPLKAFNCVHPDDLPGWIELNAKTFAEKIPFFAETRVVVDGEIRWIRAESVPRDLPDGSIVWEGVLTDMTDVKLYEAQLQKANRDLQQSLQEKEILLKEIHHRVKNNLLVISSLLNWQGEGLQDRQLLGILEDSQRRLSTMALIHEKLYGSTNLETIDLGEYLDTLAQQLMDSSRRNPEEIQLKTDFETILVNVETATPFGLIVNELILNVLEHAFPPNHNQAGYLRLGLQRTQSPAKKPAITLTVEDNGVGFPNNFDHQQTESLGWQLINLLTQQLDGQIQIVQKGVTRIILTFQELNYRRRI